MSGRLLLLAALVLMVGFAPAPLPRRADAGRDDLRKMQGLWVVIRYERDGRNLLPRYSTEIYFRYQGKRKTCELGLQVRSRWDVELSPGSSPRALTETMHAGSHVMRGIYRFDGDDLVICHSAVHNGPRPTEFDSKGDRYLIVLRRR